MWHAGKVACIELHSTEVIATDELVNRPGEAFESGEQLRLLLPKRDLHVNQLSLYERAKLNLPHTQTNSHIH